MPKKKPQEETLEGEYGGSLRDQRMRVRGDQIQVSHDLDLSGSVEQVTQTLRDQAHGLVDVNITTDYRYGRYGGSDRDVLVLTGWRDMTTSERNLRDKLLAEQRQKVRRNTERDRQQYERLKKRFEK